MLDHLRKKNPGLKMYSVLDPEFCQFGRVIPNIDAAEIIAIGKKFENPKTGIQYLPSEEKLEALAVAKQIRTEIFGTLPTETGYCWGHNSLLNATEWHTSSEINIAVTPLVLLLGHLWDIKDGRTDSSRFTAFYVPEGTVLEVYATTTHYCPCQVQEEGFGWAVVLPEGTNTPLEIQPEDRLIVAKNKWVIAHDDNAAMIESGITPGISGTNIEIKY